jgi:ADP-ribose pyrophosphatase YjhB (NUDIX family)
MAKLREATLLFLIKEGQNKITDVCLAMKKRGFGMNRWNGVGGKVNAAEGETVEAAAKRETKEEIGVEVKDANKVAELAFYFPHNPAWDQVVHVYLSREWQGDPKESEEMNPKWFSSSDLPFDKMWPDDIFWLPEVIRGNMLKAKFTFGENDTIKEKKVNIVESF